MVSNTPGTLEYLRGVATDVPRGVGNTFLQESFPGSVVIQGMNKTARQLSGVHRRAGFL